MNSIKNGVYDLHIDHLKVHPHDHPEFHMSADGVFMFARLYGAVFAATTLTSGGVTTYTLLVDGYSSLYFYNCNAGSVYSAAFDFDGNGDNRWDTDDWIRLAADYNRPLTWTN